MCVQVEDLVSTAQKELKIENQLEVRTSYTHTRSSTRVCMRIVLEPSPQLHVNDAHVCV
jgi:hypothetical protein